MANAELQYNAGTRVYEVKDGLRFKIIRLDNDILIQDGNGLRPAKRGDYVVALPSGQQFPISPNIFQDLFVGLPGLE